MAALTATGIADLVVGTLRELGPLKFQNIAQSLQHYEVFSRWFKKDKVLFENGLGIQRTLMTALAGSARHTGLTSTNITNIQDVLTTMQVDWVHAEASWALIYQTDILMNAGKSQIVSVIKARRASALIDLVEELEDKAWGTPPSSTDTTLPWGVRYYVVTNATEGFNGGAPTGHTTVAKVNPTTYTTWNNYTDTYSAATKADLVKAMRTAHRKVKFVSPISVPEYTSEAKDRYRLYTNEDVISAFEDVGEAQNENLGRDIASMDGQMVFRGHPIVWVPKLDVETDDPLYMIDHGTFYPVVLKGDFLRESEAQQNANQRRVYEMFVDLTYNFICVNRRSNAVIYKV